MSEPQWVKMVQEPTKTEEKPLNLEDIPDSNQNYHNLIWIIKQLKSNVIKNIWGDDVINIHAFPIIRQ